MRSNLLVNEFVLRAVSERSLVLYDANAKRTFMHIDDCVRGYMLAIDEQEKMAAVSTMSAAVTSISASSRSRMRSKSMSSATSSTAGSPITISRNFTVSFAKIEALGFECRIGLEDTLQELIKLYRFYRPRSSDEHLVF